jgi:hypothetical protein
MLVIPDDNAGEETDAWKLEVPCPNFITQGVSPRRDAVYGIRQIID